MSDYFKRCNTLHLRRIIRFLVESPEKVNRLAIIKETGIQKYTSLDDALMFLKSLGLIDETNEGRDQKLFFCNEEQKEHLKSMKGFGGEF